MKSIFLSAIALIASASYAAAEIKVVSPWGSTVWNAGGTGDITWTTEKADASKNCHIQMMNGNITNSNMVAYVTAPDTPVKCSMEKYQIKPLNDFEAGKYWIRIGQTDDAASWAYSGVFQFKGNGTAKPFHLASNPAAAAAAATSGGSSSGKPSSTSSATQAAQSGDEESAAMQLNIQGKTLAAVAGGAVAAAVALAM
ncbi:hypothetical protein BDA99DRAFT_514296 [Phascolomyces articulosus]|uniref:Yeast cell wall synthesis Kre9/Knh1-like N-terminal domain-containing protein n=1 Tax=Phascolomyces articulosus TaxID=60185 RepID=A0AAD5KAG6_9FUNG|nr:hypothetical protein BDA99DRAFT_514296 [Phascolomyces articulosus]